MKECVIDFCLPSNHMPQEIKHESILFILAYTVITVKHDCVISNCIIFQEVVNMANSWFFSPTSNISFIVHLFWLPFSTDTKKLTLPCSQEVCWTGLLVIIGKVYLLGIIKTVVYHTLIWQPWGFLIVLHPLFRSLLTLQTVIILLYTCMGKMLSSW